MPDRVGPYELVSSIGRDERAAMHLARATGSAGLTRYVCVAIPDDALQRRAGFAKQLTEEAKLVANLRHTNVVPVYDVGEGETGAFVVMDYVPGATLAALGELPKPIALRVLLDALNGLHAVHEHADDAGGALSLVHGGLSPESIVVGTDGIARVADLPLARAAMAVEHPAPGRWSAPERALGKEVDRRADVWSAGAMAWEILAGRALSPAEAKAPPHLKSVEGAEGLSSELDAAVAGALHVDREARAPTAAAFAKELASAARSAGMLAEVDAVAEHVQREAGPELAKRRSRAPEPPPAAEPPPAQAGGASTIIGFAAPPPPGMPPAPLGVKETPISMLALKVDLSRLAGDRANTAVLGAVANAEPPPPMALPVSAGPGAFARARALLAGPLARREKIALGAGAGLLGLFVIVLVAKCGAGGATRATAVTSASASASASAAPDLEIVGALPASASNAPAPREGSLRITANGPIAKVGIEARTVDVDPAPSVDIELTPAERAKTVRVFVTSTDDRVAMAVAGPGVRGLDVVFGDRAGLPPPPPPPSSRAATATTATAKPAAAAPPPEKRTWPKRRPRK